MFYYKIHQTAFSQVVAICDEDLLGRIFEEELFILDVKQSFYGGKKIGEEFCRQLLQDAGNLNIAGEKAVQLCLDLGLIEKEELKRIHNIPFIFLSVA